jgi:hypothetical protein
MIKKFLACNLLLSLQPLSQAYSRLPYGLATIRFEQKVDEVRAHHFTHMFITQTDMLNL